MKSLFSETLKSNKAYLMIAFIFAIFLTLIGSGRIVGLVIFSFLLVLFSQKNLAKFKKSDQNSSSSKNLKTLFNCYLLLLIAISSVFLLMFLIGVAVNKNTTLIILQVPFLTKPFLSNETSYSLYGSIIIGLIFVINLIRISIKQLNSSNEIKRLIILLSTIYIPVLYIAFYLVFLILSNLGDNMNDIHFYFFITSIIVFIINLIININMINTEQRVFITGSKEKVQKKHRLLH